MRGSLWGVVASRARAWRPPGALRLVTAREEALVQGPCDHDRGQAASPLILCQQFPWRAPSPFDCFPPPKPRVSWCGRHTRQRIERNIPSDQSTSKGPVCRILANRASLFSPGGIVLTRGFNTGRVSFVEMALVITIQRSQTWRKFIQPRRILEQSLSSVDTQAVTVHSGVQTQSYQRAIKSRQKYFSLFFLLHLKSLNFSGFSDR